MYIEVMYSMTSQCRFLRHSAYVEEYRNQHQPTPLLDFLRHVMDTRLGAPSIGAYGENGFSRKKP